LADSERKNQKKIRKKINEQIKNSNAGLEEGDEK